MDADPALEIGIWQASGTPGDIAANLCAISDAAVFAARSGIDLLIFPECFLTGYFNPDGVAEIAGQVEARVVSALQEIAKSTEMALIVGLYEPRSGGVYNSALLIAADGRKLATYRKRALYGQWEKSVFSPGAGCVVAEYGGFRIAILICFDMEFPELARECASLGADLIAVPTALTKQHWPVAKHLVPARAIENQVYTAYANRTGEEYGSLYAGFSSICDPSGRRIAKGASEGTELLSASITRSALISARQDYRYLDDIRKVRSQ